MLVSKEFQFADNGEVNAFAESRAVLMFGKDWKSRDDLKFSIPQPGGRRIVDIRLGGLSLDVVKKRNGGSLSYQVSCKKNASLEDPATNVAGLCHFDDDGNLRHLYHLSCGNAINPVDGTPSQIRYSRNGAIEGGWYVGGEVDATPKEIAERIADVKRTAAAGLCAGGQDVVALKPSSLQHLGGGGCGRPGVNL